MKPYRRQFVATYHSWMSDAWLRGAQLVAWRRNFFWFGAMECLAILCLRLFLKMFAHLTCADMTASERLSLDEEYENQAAWIDDDKSAWRNAVCVRDVPARFQCAARERTLL